ncbi:transporter substrate-binding domain-containing protein [Paraburkholderia bengalensis]|uniref:Transporter substrate-binding domain-containing protein n=1 Tax=Paraburkholderia bengalensis TaxID=2747562 RepID=A0ABU8J376_9BURK
MCSSTGDYGEIGEAMLSASLLAIQQINEDPSYDFYLNPVVANPGGQLDKYFSLSQDLLYGQKIRHVVGCYTSSSRKEVIPAFERADALLWYPSHYEGFEYSDNVIYLGAAPNQHIVPLAAYMMSRHGKRVYSLGSNYVWSWESNRVMREITEANGGSILAERYTELGATDLARVMQEIQDLKPDYIFSSVIGATTAALLSAHSEARLRSKAKGVSYPSIASCNISELELRAAPPEARRGHICSSVYFQSIASCANLAFLDAFHARFGQSRVTTSDAEASYVAVHLLARAIRACGSDDPAKVREAVGACRFEAPQGPVWVDSENHHAYLTPRLGRSTPHGQFEIIQTSDDPVPPDPFLTWFDPNRDIHAWSTTQQLLATKARPQLRAIQ